MVPCSQFQSSEPFSMNQTCQHTLRKSLRQQRQKLSWQQQKQHETLACQHLLSSPYLEKAKKVAVFLSQDGELGTRSVIEALWQQSQIELYLPALETQPNWHMGFSPYRKDSKMQNNRFNIPEPDVSFEQHQSGEEMDLVLMPLVGFDLKGNRLGMGGGFYDRTFEFKLKKPQLKKPLLIGWAHACQQVEQLPNEPWDVPLDAIITENGLIPFTD